MFKILQDEKDCQPSIWRRQLARKDNAVEVRHPENKNHLVGFQSWQVLKETGFFLPKKNNKKKKKALK